MLRTGTVVAEKYEVIGLLGKGGMSRVWLARDLRLRKLWAIKEVGREGAGGELAYERALAEADLMRRLDHPALPRIVDIARTRDQALIVMDYVEGRSLKEVVAQQGPQRPEDVVGWGAQLCDALAYLHSRTPPVIYRDMKPGNVMLREDGTVRLVDFGTAREYKDGASGDTCVLGTRGYAAPEQLAQGAQTDPRTDVYSLGATLYALLTGVSPAQEVVMRPLREVNPAIDEGLERVVLKATASDPKGRYQSCEEMREELVGHLKLTRAYRDGLKRRVRRFGAVAASAVACALGGAGLLMTASRVQAATFGARVEEARLAEVSSGDGRASPAEEAYARAIAVEPGRADAYIELMDRVYKADQRFSAGEAARLEELLRRAGPGLEQAEGFDSLCCDVGVLYDVYFERGGASDGERTFDPEADARAERWFRRAVEAFDKAEKEGRPRGLDAKGRAAAEARAVIAGFSGALGKATVEGDEAKAYGDYWGALEVAAQGLDEEASLMARLRTCALVCDLARSPTHANGLRRAGIGFDRVSELVGRMEELAQGLLQEAQASEVTEALAARLGDRAWSEARENLSKAYASKTWGGEAS